MVKRVLIAGLLALAANPAFAQDTGRLAGFRVFLIWEDTGQMGPDVSHQPHVTAIDRKLGASMQVRVDIVVEGRREGMVNDTLEVSARTDDGKVVGHSLPVGYLNTGRLFRSIIVTHACGPLSVEARLGNSRRTLKVDLSCGG